MRWGIGDMKRRQVISVYADGIPIQPEAVGDDSVQCHTDCRHYHRVCGTPKCFFKYDDPDDPQGIVAPNVLGARCEPFHRHLTKNFLQGLFKLDRILGDD
jgi:hypothetical protein